MIKPEVLALEAADASAIEEVNLAYENVKEVDGLDITKEGAEAWEAAMKRYEERIDRVETRITARLRDQVQSQVFQGRLNDVTHILKYCATIFFIFCILFEGS